MGPMTKLDLHPTVTSLLEELSLELPNPSQVVGNEKSDINETRRMDFVLYNFSLRALLAGWNKVETLPAMLVMIDKTMALIEKRRHIAGLPYGADTGKNTKSVTWEIDP